MTMFRKLLLSGFGVAMLAATPSLFAQERFEDRGYRDDRRIERDERHIRQERREVRRDVYRGEYGRAYYDRAEARRYSRDLSRDSRYYYNPYLGRYCERY